MLILKKALGEFVGKVRNEYEKIINEIIKRCTNTEAFKNSQTKQVIEYIREKYGDELEFLWEKFDDNAIWRNKQNKKWYGLLCKISANKIGINSEEIIEIIDLRYQKEETRNIVDFKGIFPGYHMNKKSWITIKLDDAVETEKIYELIDNSFELSIKK